MITGDERETVGTLLSIDSGEGVLKTEDSQIKMLPLRYLCKASGH